MPRGSSQGPSLVGVAVPRADALRPGAAGGGAGGYGLTQLPRGLLARAPAHARLRAHLSAHAPQRPRVRPARTHQQPPPPAGTLHPNCQDSSGRPRRDIGTILQILNDLLSATRHYQGLPPSLTQLRCHAQCAPASPAPDLAPKTTSCEKLAAAAPASLSQARMCKPLGECPAHPARPRAVQGPSVRGSEQLTRRGLGGGRQLLLALLRRRAARTEHVCLGHKVSLSSPEGGASFPRTPCTLSRWQVGPL